MSDGGGTSRPPIALEAREEAGARLFSPSAARNRDAIRDALLPALPADGAVLEIGSGTGEHVAHFAAAAPALRWLPGDPDAASRASIAAWTEHLGLNNIAAPHAIDAAAADWADGRGPVDAVVSINIVHISPFAAAEGLFSGAGRLLGEGGLLFLYGPFARDGVHTAPSNAAFDESLRARDPRWGVRDVERDLVPLAGKSGLDLDRVAAMPANNLSLFFRRRAR